ncbi:ABC transporter ATP-binding protein [Streptomyces sp. NBS 14/10]|uniref:ABC transporter ATP-binding protein n=1 Tax=Streptomyces sp. NBS 14/10 TaxID=1945643 RepID=UPI000B7F3584|nr:ABC transporter ATP-binding protein [Streptomyces sp. NBS 14/10]KAK1177247.1 ABC transporter ATP-binding protein [Streptomyces sp. NBS 14/10]
MTVPSASTARQWAAGRLRAAAGGPSALMARQLMAGRRTTAWVLLLVVVVASVLPALVALASGALVSAAQHGDASGAALVAAAVLGGTFFALQLSDLLVQTVGEVTGRRLGHQLAQELITSVTRPDSIAPLEDSEVRAQLALAQGIADDEVAIREAVVSFANLVVLRLQAVLSGCVLLAFNAWLALFLLASYVVFARMMLAEYRDNQLGVYDDASRLRRANYLRDLALTGRAAKDIRVFGLAAWVEEKFSAYWSSGVARQRTSWTVRLGGAAAVVVAAHTALLVLTARAAAEGRLSMGQLATYATAVTGLAAITTFSMDVVYLRQGAASVPAFRWISERLGPVRDTGARTLPAPARFRAIRFEDVGFRYPGSEHWVLRHVELELRAGSSLALVGLNGAGKTTLVKLLCGFHRPTEGRITVDGVDLAHLDRHAWQRSFAAVFQNFNRYPVGFGDNVEFGVPDRPRDQDAFASALRAAGAGEILERLPQGEATVLSRQYPGGTDLSGGQWQRVAVARAVYAVIRGARILVLDEPTSALDARAEAEFYDRMVEQIGQQTMLLISHRFSTVRRADRIVVLDGGTVAENGTHQELLDAGRLYARMFTLQAERFRVQ